jgi:hypothetical protein
LIKQGATPVTEADDVVSVLRPIIGADLPARVRKTPTNMKNRKPSRPPMSEHASSRC